MVAGPLLLPPPPPSPSPSGAEGGSGQFRGRCRTPTEDLSPRLWQEQQGSGSRPLLLRELRVPVNGEEASPRAGRGGAWGQPWACCENDNMTPSPATDCLQRKINVLKNHPTEVFNFMVVSGTPRLGEHAEPQTQCQPQNFHLIIF